MARKRRRPSAPRERPHLPWDEVYPTLDLHGETAESARRLAERWLRTHQEEGVRVVRLITGRGRHSLGPPVLRGEIEDLLSALRGSVVAQVQSESAGGAFRVELRRPKRGARGAGAPPSGSPAPRPSRAPTVDPTLRRRAEESLIELGITPTPTLVEAEMRRLRAELGDGTA